MQNEPNFGKSMGGLRSRLYKQTQFAAVPDGTRPQGRMCETKPIPATPGEARPEGRASGADRAKQSQFRAVPNGPGLGDEGRGGQSCQTKPNLGKMGHLGDDTPETHIVSNKPNPARRGEHAKQTQSASAGPLLAAECAKQTQSDPGASVVGVKQSQFTEGRTRAQVPCRKGIMMVLTRRWPRENKANFWGGIASRQEDADSFEERV
jgi:hypothetical protein